MTAEEADKEIRTLKGLLWINHGCPFGALYGDDGEMQCNSCLIDFKRATTTEIQDRFRQIGMQKLSQAKTNYNP